MRFDVGRAFLESLSTNGQATGQAASAPSKESGSLFPTIQSWAGDVPDPQCGPLNLFDQESPCGWRINGGKTQTVELVLASDQPAKFGHVRVVFVEGHTSGGVQVSTRSGDTRKGTATWSVARYCDGTAMNRIDCTFSPRETLSVQLLISTNGPEIAEIFVGGD